MRFTLSLLAIAAIATPAVAQPGAANETVAVTVKISTVGLDLSTNEGRKALNARIESKLRKACEIENASAFSFGGKTIDRACLANARTQARAKAAELAGISSRSGREVAAN
ncbi:MAG: UrcA family protein [Erythrobacter sp.]